jgi:Fe-S oxidoreductase
VEVNVPAIDYDPQLCVDCQTIDCLTRCTYMDLDLATARAERDKIMAGEDSFVLTDCATCYACEEYCPVGNHPFYLIVERQEEKKIWPVPIPIYKQQLGMMAPKTKEPPRLLTAPVVNMCFFPMLRRAVRGDLFAGCDQIVGSDIFCNIMWLHTAGNSVIRERLPRAIDKIWNDHLEPSGIDEMICYHDECYGTYTQLAPAFGFDVPWKSIHLFEYLNKRLDELKDKIKPLMLKAAYQRPCSNRLSPHIDPLVDEIFAKIGVVRVDREYDRENALCCGGVLALQQRDEMAADVQKRNLDDMKAHGAMICVFNCPACFMFLGEAAARRGLMPTLMSELCQIALGEPPLKMGG